MIKFDKIKLVTKAKYIYDLNPDLVKTTISINKDNKTKVDKPTIESFVIKQKTPFNLFIQLNPSEEKCIIEFSSKILLDDYPKLISWETINQCLENIIKMRFCNLEVNNIIKDSDMISCDITNDLGEIILQSNSKQMLLANLKHFPKYHIQKYGNSGYTITKDVITDSSKIRLSIYDKNKELLKATNRNFINMLENPKVLLDYFSNKYRIETNLKTYDQIRNYCETNDTSLVNVLNSGANPLLKIFDIIFAEDIHENNHPEKDTASIFTYKKINQVRTALVMKACDNDLEKVLVLIKGCYSPNSNFSKIIKPYKTFIKSLPEQSQNRLMIGKIREKLIACQYP